MDSKSTNLPVENVTADFLDLCLHSNSTNTNQCPAVTAMLLKGASVSATNSLGETALHLLVRGINCCDTCRYQSWRRELALQLVVDDGIDPTLRDSSGLTAQDLATSLHYEAFSSTLKDLVEYHKRYVKNILRFKLSQRVLAKFAEGFVPGVVMRKWDQGNAYRIRLECGTEVFAPKDHDVYVKARDRKDPATSNGADDLTMLAEAAEMADDGQADVEALTSLLAGQWAAARNVTKLKLDPDIYAEVQKSMSAARMPYVCRSPILNEASQGEATPSSKFPRKRISTRSTRRKGAHSRN